MNDQPDTATPAGAEPMPETGADTRYTLVTKAEADQRGLTLPGRQQEIRGGHVYDFTSQTYWPAEELEAAAPALELGAEAEAERLYRHATEGASLSDRREDDPLERDRWEDRFGNSLTLLRSEGELLEHFREKHHEAAEQAEAWRAAGIVDALERLGRARRASMGEILRRAGLGHATAVRLRGGELEAKVDDPPRPFDEIREDAHGELDSAVHRGDASDAIDWSETLVNLNKLAPPPLQPAAEPELAEVWQAVNEAFRQAGGPEAVSPTAIADAAVEILRAGTPGAPA